MLGAVKGGGGGGGGGSGGRASERAQADSGGRSSRGGVVAVAFRAPLRACVRAFVRSVAAAAASAAASLLLAGAERRWARERCFPSQPSCLSRPSSSLPPPPPAPCPRSERCFPLPSRRRPWPGRALLVPSVSHTQAGH